MSPPRLRKIVRVRTDQGWPSYLRKAMRSAHYETSAALSADSGIGESVISRWLSGKTSPSAETLRRLVRPLGRPYLELLVAGGVMAPEEAAMRDLPVPPDRVVGAKIDPDLLGDLEKLDETQIQRVKDFTRGLRYS